MWTDGSYKGVDTRLIAEAGAVHIIKTNIYCAERLAEAARRERDGWEDGAMTPTEIRSAVACIRRAIINGSI
jgi:hypothetical protein